MQYPLLLSMVVLNVSGKNYGDAFPNNNTSSLVRSNQENISVLLPNSIISDNLDSVAAVESGYYNQYLPVVQTEKRRVKRAKKKKKKKNKKEKPVETGCGRRQVQFKELIVQGASTKAGDWPWHAAIYKHDNAKSLYICGGTLISKLLVLTAAHCVTVHKVPVIANSLSVVLGKYYLHGADASSEEREVFSITVHEEFGVPKVMDNDLAMLKLSAEAVFNDYVQPACVWNKKAKHRLSSDQVFGTVAGWGLDRTTFLSPQLRHANMPKLKHAECIKKNPLFYGNMLKNNRKFCAGWGNGTSPCNGDSGGGFMVFVPDTKKDNSPHAPGAWYIRGIVSLAVSFRNSACDPKQYVVFTNLTKYKDWLKKFIEIDVR